MSSALDIKVVANNTVWVYLTALDNSGNPVNISGYTIKWQMMRNNSTAPLITKKTNDSSIIIISAVNGQFAFQILAADTVNLPAGDYIHEAVATDTSGYPVTITNNDATLTAGRFFLRAQNTVQ